MFAADRALARFLTGQVASDREYLEIELSRTGSALRAVADEFKQARSSGADQDEDRTQRQAGPAAADITRRVFVVYGRDSALTQGFFDLLYAVGLEPLEWEKLVRPTGTTLPYLGQVVQNAPHLAQATLVLLSPDDIVELHPDLVKADDHEHEQAKSGQARPNVLFELGLAFMAYPEQTIIVEAGMMRPIADLAGLNVIKFDGSAIAVKKVLDRLQQAGCPADTSGTGWLNPGRFADLATYCRGPETVKKSGAGGT
jgi:predicted nucleotide-binding protein